MKITLDLNFDPWISEDEFNLIGKIERLIKKIQSNPLDEHLLAKVSLTITLSAYGMSPILRNYLNQSLPQIMPYCRVMAMNFEINEEFFDIHEEPDDEFNAQAPDEDTENLHFPISVYRSSLMLILEHLPSATQLREFYFKFYNELDDIDSLAFKQFSRFFAALPHPENLSALSLSIRNGYIGRLGGEERYFKEPEELRFLDTLSRCTNLSCFNLTANYTSDFFQDQTHLCLSKLPALETVSIEYVSMSTSIYSLAKILKNQNLKNFKCILSGVYYDYFFETLLEPQDEYPKVYRTFGESWRYFEQVIRQNSHLQSLKFNLNQAQDGDYRNLTWDNEDAVFSTSFFDTCHAMTLIPSLQELKINFPENIGRDFDTDENMPILFAYFENANHLKKLDLQCSFTDLDDELIQFSQEITLGRLGYKQEMQKHFCSTVTIEQFHASSPEVLAPYLKLKVLESLRLDVELARHLSPIIARSVLDASDEIQLPSTHEINLAKQFSRDIISQVFRQVPAIHQVCENISLHILQFLDTENIAKLSLVNGGLNSRLKKQAFENQYQLAKEARNELKPSSSLILPNKQLNSNHHYQPWEMNRILDQRISRSLHIKALNAIEFDEAFFDRHLENMLKPHLQSENLIILPIHTPGHWVGMVIQLEREGWVNLYFFDSLYNQERLQMITKKMYNAISHSGLKIKSIMTGNQAIMQERVCDSGGILIENIAKSFQLPEVIYPTTLHIREFHAYLISNFSPANVNPQRCNWSERPLNGFSIFKRTSLITEEGLINLSHHYNAEDIDKLLKCRLQDQENLNIVGALRFDNPNFCYRIHHILLAELSKVQNIIIPINTGGHWVGMLIQVKDNQEVHLIFHDAITNPQRAEIVMEKIIPIVQNISSKDIHLSVCFNMFANQDSNSSGPLLVETIVRTVNSQAFVIGTDAHSIRLSHGALLNEARNAQQTGLLGDKRCASEAISQIHQRMKGG